MFTASKWVATATSISSVLVLSSKDGGTSSSVTIGPSGIYVCGRILNSVN